MYDNTPFLSVHCKTPDNGQRNCPKDVEFYSKNKNKFEKLVLLVGFIVKIYQNARSPERQIYGSSGRKVLLVAVLAPKILRWLPEFFKMLFIPDMWIWSYCIEVSKHTLLSFISSVATRNSKILNYTAQVLFSPQKYL